MVASCVFYMDGKVELSKKNELQRKRNARWWSLGCINNLMFNKLHSIVSVLKCLKFKFQGAKKIKIPASVYFIILLKKTQFPFRH